MGHAAGAATIAVTWGNHDRGQLWRARPTHLVDDPHQLAVALHTLRPPEATATRPEPPATSR